MLQNSSIIGLAQTCQLIGHWIIIKIQQNYKDVQSITNCFTKREQATHTDVSNMTPSPNSIVKTWCSGFKHYTTLFIVHWLLSDTSEK